MIRDEILEYPFYGTITRVVEGQDKTIVVYEGVMDEHMTTDEEGRTLQTASYIISIPLEKNQDGNWKLPRKGDNISLTRYGETFDLVVDNAEPSQLGGVSIYAARNSWFDDGQE